MTALVLALFLQDDVSKKLEAKISVDLRGGLPAALRTLQEKTGVAIEVDPGVPAKIDVDREIALQLRDVRGDSAIAWVCRLYGLSWSARQGRVFLAFPDGLETRVLELSGIGRRGGSDGVPRLDIADGLGGVTVTTLEPTESYPLEEILDVVRETIEPGSWEGDHALELTWDDRLIVTHTPETVRKIEAFLAVLRRATPATVTIEADLFEASDDVLRLDASQLKELVKKDARARSFSIPCIEGQGAYAMVVGQKVSVRNVPQDELVNLYSDAAVLSVRPSVAQDGKTVRLRLGLQAARGTPHVTEMLGGKIDQPETSLVRMETVLTVENGGSTILLLPRRSREAGRPQALWIRVSAGARGPVGSVEGSEEAALAQWARLDAVEPMDLTIRETRVEEVAAFLRDSTGLNFVVDPQVDPHLKLSFQGKRARLRSALEQMLAPQGLEIVPFAEAFLIAPASADGVLRVCVESIRDLEVTPFDARVGNEEGPRQTFTGDDLVSLIMNAVAKDEWNDDHVILETGGLLVLRHRPSVIAEVRAFLERLRTGRDRAVRLRVDLLDVAGDAELPGFLSPAEADKLIAGAASREHVTLRGPAGRRLGLDWIRQISYVRDCEEELERLRTIEDTMSAVSTLSVRAEEGSGGITLELDLRENEIDAIPMQKFGKFELQTPVLGTHHATATFTVPKGKVAVVKMSGSREDEGVRVMLVREE